MPETNLDRNRNPDGLCKYSLILNRAVKAATPAAQHEIQDALKVLREHGVLDDGTDPDKEFFVIRLKDKCAYRALLAYARSATEFGMIEYGRAVVDLANKSDEHPSRKLPD